MPRFALLSFAVLLLCAIIIHAADAVDPGVLPLGDDGKPLNLDFETGTLKDWTVTGEAFVGQPIKGDTVNKRRGDMKSRHQGEYWIGGYELKGDPPQGTLTSVPFTVTHPWASFLVGGGAHASTRVDIILVDSGKAIFTASGRDAEDLYRVAVDLQKYKGKKIQVRLVDQHTGGWGHLNFDDFRFHKEKPAFKNQPTFNAPDVVAHAGLTPKEAAAAMTVPEGFKVSLIAGEPDLRQPIAFCFDDRGRIWVAEAYSYPIRRADKDAKDRILIFEDVDGDGTFKKRTVFMEGLNLVSGLEIGFGSVWIGAAPYLLYVPIKPGEDKPAGKPQILLDGWGYQDTHETLNAFTWGPDGWLYGCHGVFTHSRVGKPGTPDDKRVPINAGVWRYHPTRHVFEVFAHGTSNPWGIDFNDQGQAFITACVIPHVFHIIPGARYQRQAGAHFNPYTYADIGTIADHFHWTGANPHGGNGRSDSAGGGHAHCGAMVYLGGTWPAEYRNQLFMNNIHGHRVNMDILKPKGSGYVASHGPDFLLANDSYARFIALKYGPDGNVYLIDWYDKQACHHGNPDIWDRETGRMYRIAYRGAKAVKVDLTKKTDAELVALQTHENDWYVQHARRLLQERDVTPETVAALEKLLAESKEERVRLRAMWALRVTGGLTPELIHKLLADASENIRAWAVRFTVDARRWRLVMNAKDEKALEMEKWLVKLSEGEKSPLVRLALASAAPQLSWVKSLDLLKRLVKHPEDATDHNLPLMYWYALEPHVDSDPPRAFEVALASPSLQLASFLSRVLASAGTEDDLEFCLSGMGKRKDAETEKAILGGMLQGLAGRSRVKMPTSWPVWFAELSASKDAIVRSHAQALAIKFGDKNAFDILRKTLSDDKIAVTQRQQALTALVEAHDAGLPPVLLDLLKSPTLRAEAIRALAGYDAAETPARILDVYPSLTAAEKRDAIATLSARAGYARALMAAVKAKKVPPTDISADIVRQLGNLNDKDVSKTLGEMWGQVRTTPAERKATIARYKTMLTASGPAPDPMLGRAIFQKTCAQCHLLFGVGGKVGPDITGSNRANLDYLLENIFDPSAVIPKEYAVSILTLQSGRVITGIVREETAVALTVVTATETLTVSKKDIESRQASETSMMPEDQWKPWTIVEFRALVAYLQGQKQVPTLATAENVGEFFDGKSLAGWQGNPKLWSVEKGEIVGKTTGLKRNEFLVSTLAATDFRLSLKVKLTPDAGNSGVQFRSESLPDGEMRGPQADVGAGWWGKLYEENGRGLIWKESGEKHVKPGEWNEYVIEAVGGRVKTWINGQLCVDLNDDKISRRGVFGLQIHAGSAMEVRFRDLKLEVLKAKE
jgi:putative membrane-bound dehydrogenase-like protein